MPRVIAMITHFRLRNCPFTRRGKTGSRAAYSAGGFSLELMIRSRISLFARPDYADMACRNLDTGQNRARTCGETAVRPSRSGEFALGGGVITTSNRRAGRSEGGDHG